MAFYMAWFHKKTHIKVIVSQLMDVDGCYIYVYIYPSEKTISHPISHPIFSAAKHLQLVRLGMAATSAERPHLRPIESHAVLKR